MTAKIPEMMAAKATSHPRKNEHPEEPPALQKNLQYYLTLDYPIELVRDDGIYVASHPDLPGCVSMGSTPNEAIDNLAEVRELWLEGQLANGSSIPEPSKPEQYSGKFVLRIPKLLHRMADHRARQEGISLNSLISSVLSGALGYPMPEANQFRFAHEKSEPIEYLMYEQKYGYWCFANQDWDIGRRHATAKAYGEEPSLAWFVSSVAEQICNHDKSVIKLSEIEDYHRAQEKIHSNPR